MEFKKMIFIAHKITENSTDRCILKSSSTILAEATKLKYIITHSHNQNRKNKK